MPTRDTLLDELLELTVGPVAHGGHCVARVADEPGGRVVFVRHALPGERVRARVTEDAGARFVRADAVEVLVASPERVEPACSHAGPARCGGCDWQHASIEEQRRLKAAVVREQFARLADLDVAVEVEALPGPALGWRSRIGYAVDDRGRPGLRRHRSHEIEPIDSCPLGVAGVGDNPALRRRWPRQSRLELVSAGEGRTSVLADRPRGRAARSSMQLIEGPARIGHEVAGLRFEVSPAAFWQVHPAAAVTFAGAVLDALEPRLGEAALDLYAGAGLFTALIARAVGPTGRVLGIESDRHAVADSAANLRDLPWAEVARARVSASALRRLDFEPAVVVLDPPRAGAGRAVIDAVTGLAPRALCYVACDPASLARDVRFAADCGWNLGGLRVFDAFPMTHHIECVALLTPN